VPLYTGDLSRDLLIVSRHGVAEKVTGGLSSPGKMPCPAWGISVLAKQPGTTCSECYALKRNYRRETVQEKLKERYRGLFNLLWTLAMAFLIHHYCDRYFRFFESGDLQEVNHLKNIVTIAEAETDVKIWMPTREIETVRAVLKEIVEFPENLTVRVSASKIDGKPPRALPQPSPLRA
jgi:hypothetical protein